MRTDSATTAPGRDRTGEPPARVTAPGIVLGLGLGGFVDGIALHQILGWHHMLSATPQYPPTTLHNIEVNMMADGLFHAATWALVAVGLAMLWKAAQSGGWVWPGRTLAGWIVVGWGIFNIVEGIIDHHILGIHHVHPTSAHPLAWDLGFLALGATLILGGCLLQRSRVHDTVTVP